MRVPIKGPAFYVVCGVYVVTPLTGLWYVMQWANAESQKKMPAMVAMKKREAEGKPRDVRRSSSGVGDLQGLLNQSRAEKEAGVPR